MKHILRWICVILCVCLVGCAVKQVSKPIPKREPLIRVGLLWDTNAIEFSMLNTSQITSYDGTFIARGVKGGRWRAEVKQSEPAQYIYRLQTPPMETGDRARTRAREIEKMGFDAGIKETGKALRVGGRTVNDNRSYRVFLQKIFRNEDDAADYRDSIRNRLQMSIVNEKARNARGIITLKNLGNGQAFESSKPILIRGSSVTLYDVPVGVGFHWESREIRSYPETIVFQLDNNGRLAVVNILSIEAYLQGVIPSEMPSGFPSEALKAQAVAARSEVLSKLGHSHLDDPFDVCADVHCQVYSGLTKRSSSTDDAVRRTRGWVLSLRGKIIHTVYSAVCGGHGEDADKAWGGKAQPYLQGVFDGSIRLRRYGPLTNERKFKTWIDDRPAAYCNTTRDNLPAALNYTKKYFRWEERYTQWELRRLIQEKMDRNVGDILDLVPMERGVSGRIVRLKIRGSRGEFTIDRELNIRRALSANTLWSSCFYIIRQGWKQGIPGEFVLKGAGFGHGVGMCQTGAAMMALAGKRFHQILKHYFQDVKIRRLY